MRIDVDEMFFRILVTLYVILMLLVLWGGYCLLHVKPWFGLAG